MWHSHVYAIPFLKYKNFFCEFGQSTTYKYESPCQKGDCSLVSAGLGGVCVSGNKGVSREFTKASRCLTKYDRTCRYGLYQVGTENALSLTILNRFFSAC